MLLGEAGGANEIKGVEGAIMAELDSVKRQFKVWLNFKQKSDVHSAPCAICGTVISTR